MGVEGCIKEKLVAYAYARKLVNFSTYISYVIDL